MKKIFALLMALCLASSAAVSFAAMSADAFDAENPKAVIETNSTDSRKGVGDEWYWNRLFDGEISTDDNKITETYANYSVHPDKKETAWVNIDLGGEYELSGVRIFARLGWPTQAMTKGYIYVSDDGENYMRSDLQEFSKDERSIALLTKFGRKNYNVTARYIKLEAVQVGGSDSEPHWNMEEVEFLTAKSGQQKKKVSELSEFKADKPQVTEEKEKDKKTDPILSDKSKWEVSVNSVHAEGHDARAAFDDNKDTFWHSKFTAENGQVTWMEPGPYVFNIVFPGKVLISGMEYQPRNSVGGTITRCEIYGSESDSGELVLLTTAQMTPDTGAKKVPFYANVSVKRIMLRITETVGGSVGTAAEIDFMEKRDNLKTVALGNYADYEAENKLYLIDTSKFSATSETPVWLERNVTSMFDGGGDSFWQTEETTFPVSFDVDMKKEQEIVKIECLPRQSDDCHGNWKAFEIWAGDKTDGLSKVYETTDSPKNLDKKIIEFSEPVKARYLRFIINDAVYNRASCAELYFYRTKQAKDKAEAENYEKYVLKIDSKKMTVTKGTNTYEKELDTAPYIYPGKGTTLIPLRGLIEEMGGEIAWDGETQEIKISAPTGKIEMQVQRKTVYSEHPNYKMVRYTLTVAPKIKDSRTFIPLRFVSEHLGYNVTWNGDTREITIETK